MGARSSENTAEKNTLAPAYAIRRARGPGRGRRPATSDPPTPPPRAPRAPLPPSRARGMMGALASLPARRRALAAARALGARAVAAARRAGLLSRDARTDDDAARYDPTACPCYYTENYFPKTVRSAGAEATNALPTDPLARRLGVSSRLQAAEGKSDVNSSSDVPTA